MTARLRTYAVVRPNIEILICGGPSVVRVRARSFEEAREMVHAMNLSGYTVPEVSPVTAQAIADRDSMATARRETLWMDIAFDNRRGMMQVDADATARRAVSPVLEG